MARCARLARKLKHKFDLKLYKNKLADGIRTYDKSVKPWLTFEFINLGWQPWPNT